MIKYTERIQGQNIGKGYRERA
jgi:hypothetical protein